MKGNSYGMREGLRSEEEVNRWKKRKCDVYSSNVWCSMLSKYIYCTSFWSVDITCAATKVWRLRGECGEKSEDDNREPATSHDCSFLSAHTRAAGISFSYFSPVCFLLTLLLLSLFLNLDIQWDSIGSQLHLCSLHQAFSPPRPSAPKTAHIVSVILDISASPILVPNHTKSTAKSHFLDGKRSWGVHRHSKRSLYVILNLG